MPGGHGGILGEQRQDKGRRRGLAHEGWRRRLRWGWGMRPRSASHRPAGQRAASAASAVQGGSGCGLRDSPTPAPPVLWTIAQRAHLGCCSSPGRASSQHTGQEPTCTAWARSSWLLTLPFWMGHQTHTGEGCSGLLSGCWNIDSLGRVLRQVEPWHLRVYTQSTQPTRAQERPLPRAGGSDSLG